MHKPTAFAAGRVVFYRMEKTDSGRDFLRLTLELVPRESNGKSFANRVEVLTFRNPTEIASGMEKNDWLTVAGEVEADTYTHKGVTRAKLVIIGTVTRLPVSGADPGANRRVEDEEGEAS